MSLDDITELHNLVTLSEKRLLREKTDLKDIHYSISSQEIKLEKLCNERASLQGNLGNYANQYDSSIEALRSCFTSFNSLIDNSKFQQKIQTLETELNIFIEDNKSKESDISTLKGKYKEADDLTIKNERELDRLFEDQENLNLNVSEKKASLLELDSTITRKFEDFKEKKARCDEMREAIKKKELEVDELKLETEKMKEEIDQTDQRINQISEGIEELKSNNKSIEDRINTELKKGEEELEGKMSVERGRKEKLDLEIDELASCQQTTSQSLQQREEELDERKEKKRKLLGEVDGLKMEEEMLGKSLESMRSSHQQLEIQLESLSKFFLSKTKNHFL